MDAKTAWTSDTSPYMIGPKSKAVIGDLIYAHFYAPKGWQPVMPDGSLGCIFAGDAVLLVSDPYRVSEPYHGVKNRVCNNALCIDVLVAGQILQAPAAYFIRYRVQLAS